jgi:hypothetical protein
LQECGCVEEEEEEEEEGEGTLEQVREHCQRQEKTNPYQIYRVSRNTR